jgi:4'-phosphopantetheinyl transferase
MMGSLAWSSPPSAPTLSAGEVHVWGAALGDGASGQPPPARLLRRLSPDELARAERFHFARHRDRFVAARALLRLLAGRYVGIPAREVRFNYGRRGKPCLHPSLAGPNRLRFNVSHSDGLALLAFGWDSELGVDIEIERTLRDWESIAERYFTAGERAALGQLPSAERDRAFLRAWTRKEALFKATGDGLSRALDGQPEDSGRWWLEDLDPAPGFAAALVVEDEPARISCWRYRGALEDEAYPPL